MKKSKSLTVSVTFQKAFVGTILAVFAVQTIHATYTGITQYFENPYAAGYEWYYLYTVAIPAAVFLLAILLRPKQPTLLGRTFVALLVSVAALTVYSLVASLAQQLYMQNIIPGSGYELVVAYEAAGAAVFFATYTVLLLLLSRNNK